MENDEKCLSLNAGGSCPLLSPRRPLFFSRLLYRPIRNGILASTCIFATLTLSCRLSNRAFERREFYFIVLNVRISGFSYLKLHRVDEIIFGSEKIDAHENKNNRRMVRARYVNNDIRV